MPIHWFTVLAQAVNFLILVWLLQRFLYKPILRAIDEREKGIAARLAKADSDKAEANKDRHDFQLKNESFARERADLLKQAMDDAAAERQRLLAEARKDADSLRDKRQDALRNELRNLSREITCRTQTEVFAIARKALADLATASLEERMTEVFVQHLRALAGPSKEQLAAALKSSAAPARLRSAFDLPLPQRLAIEATIRETFATETQMQFETAPEVVSGIELSVNGQKVSWSIADYLTALEKSCVDLLRKDDDLAPGSGLEKELGTNQEKKSITETSPNNDAKAGPKCELNHEPEPVTLAPKADH
jgi:F-type H+-transporting ATPase subunit b